VSENEKSTEVRLGIAALLNGSFGVIQVVAGIAIGSVVVLADAAHQAVDVLGLLTAFVAVRVAARPATEEWSFGFGKADALGGLVSALLLVASVGWIVIESVRRLVEPEPVSGGGVIGIGLVAIVVNGAGVLLLRGARGSHGDHAGHAHDLGAAVSVRAARLHLLTDLAGSVLVVAAGVGLALGGPAWIDPVASLALSSVVLIVTGRLLRSSVHLLLDRVPDGITCDAISQTLRAHDAVGEVHHVHLRPLGGGEVSVTAHVVVDRVRLVHDAQTLVADLGVMLLEGHGIDHTTLQVECHDCGHETHDRDVSRSAHG